MCSDFNLLNRFASGEDVTPILKQRQEVGFNFLRVWTEYDIGLIGRCIPCPYDRINAFLKLCARYELYVEFTAYTGIDNHNHWNNLVSVVQDNRSVLLELVNENNIHPIDLNPYTRPVGLHSSHGSNGSDSFPVTPRWSYNEYHSNDANEWWRRVGHNSMEISDIFGGPTIANENTRFPDKDSNANHAYDAARAAALLCAGSCFHSVHGKSSELWTGIELDCARAWTTGAKSVDLRYQAGRYVRIDDPNFLRTYQRILSNGSAFTVQIRK